MTKKPDYGLYSLIASLVGFFLGCNIICGILGVYFANEAQKNNQDMSMADIGKVIGIIDIILGTLVIICFVLFYVVFGAIMFHEIF